MAVVRDGNATAPVNVSGVSTMSNPNLTVGTDPNTVLICAVGLQNVGITVTAANWDFGGTPQAMTEIGRATTPGGVVGCRLYGLLNPTPGNKICTVSWTGGTMIANINCASYKNCDLSGGSVATTFINVTTLTGTAVTSGGIIVPGTAGQMVIDAFNSSRPGTTNTGAQATLSLVTTGVTCGMGEQLIVGSSAQSTWSYSGAGNFSDVGCAIRAFNVPLPSVNLMGVPRRRFLRR